VPASSSSSARARGGEPHGWTAGDSRNRNRNRQRTTLAKYPMAGQIMHAGAARAGVL
jgi:hypothetical protein